MYKGYENITICDHPLLKHKVTMLRNKNTGTNEFRKVVEEISMLVGYHMICFSETAVPRNASRP